MIIVLSPYRPAAGFDPLALERDGSTLLINGSAHDIAALAAREPDEDGLIEWPDPIVRVDGETVTVRFPIGPYAPESARFPNPITDPPDGPVTLPQAWAEPETPDHGDDDV
jgi:hypothetical protein